MDTFFPSASAPSSSLPSFFDSKMLSQADKRDPEKVGSLFEAMFYRTMLKQMRDSEMGDPLFGSAAASQLKEMQHAEMANTLATQGHLGIKELIADFIREEQDRSSTESQQVDPSSNQTAGLLKDQTKE